MSTPSVALRGVRFSYRGRDAGRHETRAVFSCDALDIGVGLSLLLGPNGAGKSTLLKLAAGIEQPDAGQVLVAGRDLWTDEVEARRGIAYVPEQPDLSPYATVGEVLHLIATLRLPKGQAAVAARDALERVGLGELPHRTVRELSMGQRRRALFGAALIGSPDLLLLDEPLETMDRTMRELIVDWLGTRLTEGAAAVVATHEIEPFAPLATRVILVRHGTACIVEPLPTDLRQRLALLDGLARGIGIAGEDITLSAR